jgi:hypothetical protein
MLPGFRFLFAAIVLCFSILVFGLGAAALLRAAHEEFASKPSWRGTPETMFGQQDEARPVLALLQVEPEAKVAATDVAKEPVGEPGAPQRQDDTPSAVALPEPAAAPSPAPEPQKVAALSTPEPERPVTPSPPEETPPAAAAKSEPAVSEPAKVDDTKSQSSPGEGQAMVERSSSPGEVPASEHETRIATVEDATPKAAEKTAEPSPAPSEPMKPPVPMPQARPQDDPVAAMIATLGGSPEAIDAQAPPKASNGPTNAASDKDSIRKRLRARHAAAAKERLRLVQRSRVTHHAAVQPQQQQQFPPPFLMEPSTAAAQTR